MAKTTASDTDNTAGEGLDKATVAPKGHATPTRKEREAARKRPLVGANTPEARKAARDAQNRDRDRARVGMMNGEEKYLPARDRGAQKRYVRDYVDARWGFGELLLPLAGVLIIGLFFDKNLQGYITIAFYGYFVLFLLDVFLMEYRLNKKLKAKFGDDRVEKFRWYAGMRSAYFRQLRTPKPQVKRGDFPK